MEYTKECIGCPFLKLDKSICKNWTQEQYFEHLINKYTMLKSNYDCIIERYLKLYKYCQRNFYLPIWEEPYTELERSERNNLNYTFWTIRDWQDYNIDKEEK
jgi:hypothetical protein